MITEDYVSFETAKLLKEKGFDEECSCFYNNIDYGTPGLEVDGQLYYKNSALDDEEYATPTLQMAMKWLRTKNIFIDIYHYNSKIAPFIWRIFAYNILMPQTAETFEEAAEASINYVLKHWDAVNMALDDYYKYDKMLPKIW